MKVRRGGIAVGGVEGKESDAGDLKRKRKGEALQEGRWGGWGE